MTMKKSIGCRTLFD